MSTIFTKIINREIPGQFIYEDDKCVVIMDKFPVVEGQSMVISKVEVDYVFDLDDDLYAHMFAVAKKVAEATDKAFGTERTCLVVEGFEVPHVHIKLYPIKTVGEMTSLASLVSKRHEETNEILAKQAAQIKAAL